MGHPARIRVSDAEREAVVAHLGHATSEGRLTLDEFGARSRQAYASRTRIELYSVVDDLPPPPGAPRAAPAPAPAPMSSAPTMALTFGVLSLPLGLCLPLGVLCAGFAVVLAFIALGGAGRRPGRQRAMAIGGLVCGILGVVVPIVLFLGLSVS